MVRRTSRILFRIVTAFLLVIGTYFLMAGILMLVPVNTSWKAAENGTEIFIQSNGVHTAIILPVENKICNWNEFISSKDTRSAGQQFTHIAFGWGDKGFYLETPQWSDLKFSTAFEALFWLDEAAMHVSWKSKAPVVSASCRRLRVNETEYRLLIKQVRESFGEKGVRCITGKSYGMNDAFYEAAGCYSLFNTCNAWTGRLLRNAGIRAAAWTPFDKSVFYQLKNS